MARAVEKLVPDVPKPICGPLVDLCPSSASGPGCAHSDRQIFEPFAHDPDKIVGQCNDNLGLLLRRPHASLNRQPPISRIANKAVSMTVHLRFIGSTAGGKTIMAATSENLLPVTLELGGKKPAVFRKPTKTFQAWCSENWPMQAKPVSRQIT